MVRTDEDGESAVVRHIALEGASNFRDAGGYRTADGRRVRWGQIFRADSLSDLTAADMQVIGRLGIRTIYDLRSEHERRCAPDRVSPGITLRVSAQGSQHAKVIELSQRIRRHITAGVFDPHHIEPWICDRYRLFPTEELGECRRYARALLTPGCFPIVVHCASGKDRTGFAIAATLLVLGVSRETILEDYLLSNRYRRSLARQLPRATPGAVLQALSGVRPSYLSAALDALDAAWGTDDAFISQGLGLDRVDRLSLQEALLEP